MINITAARTPLEPIAEEAVKMSSLKTDRIKEEFDTVEEVLAIASDTCKQLIEELEKKENKTKEDLKNVCDLLGARIYIITRLQEVYERHRSLLKRIAEVCQREQTNLL